ncbi:MAG: GNAT family N-acetyltransferase, partial [Pseudomonadota bacterium]
MNEDSSIRPARASEAVLLSELAVRSKAYWGYSTAFMDACREELSVSAYDISNSSREYEVCEVNASVVGYFAIEPISKSEYELQALFVEPLHIGCGYGRILIEQAK